MSSDQLHSESTELLRYLDGELSRRRARRVRQHLEACWECRAELEQIQAAVAGCVQYRRDVLETCLPAPPQPWKDLSRGFDEIDSSLAGESLLARLVRLVSPRAMPLRVAVGCARLRLVAAVALYELRETPSVQAAALLKRAVTVAQNRPVKARAIRITTRNAQMTRVLAGASLKPALQDAGLARLFQAAHYNWDDPLNPRSYSAWRDHLAAKR